MSTSVPGFQPSFSGRFMITRKRLLRLTALMANLSDMYLYGPATIYA
jgi:hypothetical protein